VVQWCSGAVVVHTVVQWCREGGVSSVGCTLLSQ
jgi:hypothetical protein